MANDQKSIFNELEKKVSPASLSRHFQEKSNQTNNEHLIHVLQWNVLAQALSYIENNFVRATNEIVSYEQRKWRILEQIVIRQPDLCSLEEVDIYDCFLKDELPKFGYKCFFTPKINSKCFMFKDNLENFKGPDGTLLCYKEAKFEEIQRLSLELPNDGRSSKEVFAVLELKHKPSSTKIIFIGTHFKSKKVFADSRKNQAETIAQLLIKQYSDQSHIILSGDFNGKSDEPFYSIFRNIGLESSYRFLMNDQEPNYTTWKIKGRDQIEKEEASTIDYIFYKPKGFTPIAFLNLPTKEEIGPNGLPSKNYPSDHLAIETKFIIKTESI